MKKQVNYFRMTEKEKLNNWRRKLKKEKENDRKERKERELKNMKMYSAMKRQEEKDQMLEEQKREDFMNDCHFVFIPYMAKKYAMENKAIYNLAYDIVTNSYFMIQAGIQEGKITYKDYVEVFKTAKSMIRNLEDYRFFEIVKDK